MTDDGNEQRQEYVIDKVSCRCISMMILEASTSSSLVQKDLLTCTLTNNPDHCQLVGDLDQNKVLL